MMPTNVNGIAKVNDYADLRLHFNMFQFLLGEIAMISITMESIWTCTTENQ